LNAAESCTYVHAHGCGQEYNIVVGLHLQVPKFTEIVLVPKRSKGQHPALYLYTSLARMMRPVINLQANEVEYIGTFEQLYLDICIVPEEAYQGVSLI
jgi:DNA-directed RNA polymerase I subunit RPA2